METTKLSKGLLVLAMATLGAAYTASAFAQGKIVAASDVGYPPFSMSSPKGGFEGFDIDVAEALSQQLGTKIEVIDQPWSTTFAGLNAKKFDMVLAPVIITKERAAGLLFSEPHGDALYQFIVRKDGPQVNKLDDLRGKTIAVNKGNIFDKWLSARTDEYGWTINRYDKNSDAVQAVASGQAFAAYMFASAIGWSAMKNATLVPSNLTINNNDVVAYVFRSSDKELRNRVDEAIECLKRNGTIKALYKKWTGQEVLDKGATTTIYPGHGHPDFNGYDPTPSGASCK